MKILSWLWAKIKWLFRVLWDLLWGLAKKYLIEPGLKIALVRVGGMLLAPLGMWFAAILFGPPSISNALNPATANYSEEFRKLRDDLYQSRLEVKADRDKHEQERMADAIEQQHLREEIKRLLAQGGQILSVTRSQGDAVVRGEGKPIGGKYADNWISAEYDSAKFWYEFQFRLKDASATILRKDGKEMELYSASLVSKKDSTAVINLEGYSRMREVNIISPPPPKQFYWDDISVNGDFVFSGGFMGGASVSFFTWTEGGLDPEGVILRFPEIGLATDFRERLYLALGIRYNLGRHIPILSDFFVSPKIGWGSGGFSFMVGLGTTL